MPLHRGHACRMHIDAIFTRETAGSISGAWVSFERLCRGVAEAGHRVEVLAWPESPPPGPAGRAAEAQRLRDSCAVFAGRLERRWRAQRPDIVHIELAGNVGDTAQAVARRLGLVITSVFHHMHLYAPEGQRDRVLAMLAGFHRGCTCTVAQSSASRELLLKAGGPDAALVADGVDCEQFHPRRRDPALRAAWAAAPDAPVLFWAGRMMPTKGLGLLAAACSAARERRGDVRAVVAGDGPEAAALRQALPWAAYAGVLRGEALAAAYASADIFVFPSPEEPWGNAVLEAAASGLAVVARSGGAAAEGLLPKGACVAPLPVTEQGFCDAVVRLVTDGEERRRLAQAARNAAEARSITGTVAGWIAIWDAARRSAG